MNGLYGTDYIIQQRSSGYKSTIYAIAELVDNCVDARATNVQIVLVEKESHTGNRRSVSLSEIHILDNGCGMDESRLNKSLTFSAGEGRNDRRIGAFGVGLPNASISVCRRVDVMSRTTEEGVWRKVWLDLDEQKGRDNPGFDPAEIFSPRGVAYDFNEWNTVISWRKCDKLDVSRASTLADRAQMLLGRIYRYQILDGLNITIKIVRGDNRSTEKMEHVVPYDPLFVSTEKTYITDKVWKAAYTDDPYGRNKHLRHLEEFNSQWHYKKLIEGCKENQSTKQLFLRHEDYWDTEYKVIFDGKPFTWKIRASYACKQLTNPGIRSGGITELGKHFGVKMEGKDHFKSANIFFIRANREIDFGNYGLYKVSDVKNRFWTIEIHFDSDLDELMEVSNNKQQVGFWAVKNTEIEYNENHRSLPPGARREILFAQITETIKRCIREIKKIHSQWAKEFKERETVHINTTSGESPRLPQVESLVYEVLPPGEEYSEDEINELTRFLKGRYRHIETELIKDQVEVWASGLTNTIVLYSESGTGDLFELVEKRGKKIVLINSNHAFYQNVLAPLKSEPILKVFTISIEMLISSLAIEMEKMINSHADRYEKPLKRYLQELSTKLTRFIEDGMISVQPEKLYELLQEVNESDE